MLKVIRVKEDLHKALKIKAAEECKLLSTLVEEILQKAVK